MVDSLLLGGRHPPCAGRGVLQLPKDAIKLLRSMLELNPNKRISAVEALCVSQGPCTCMPSSLVALLTCCQHHSGSLW